VYVYRTAPFSLTLNDPNPDFKVKPLFDAEWLRNGTRYRHRPTTNMDTNVVSNDLEWLWVTWRNIQWHEASRGFSELLVVPVNVCTASYMYARAMDALTWKSTITK